MRYVLAAFCGMTVTLIVFAAGVAFSLAYLSADRPAQLAKEPALEFPFEPVRVRSGDASRSDEDRPSAESSSAELLEVRSSEPAVATASLADAGEQEEAAQASRASFEPEEGTSPSAARDPRHVAWCRDRYRSYQVETNSYRPYSGGLRECVSPYSNPDIDTEAETAALEPAGEPQFIDGSQYPDYQPVPAGPWTAGRDGLRRPAEPALRTVERRDHVADCFARYRSYRPADNTYQPFGGGPRRQCR